MSFALLKTQISYYFQQTVAFFWVKLGFGLLYAVLLPHQLILQGLMILFVTDFITGVIVARRMKRLSSAGMRRGVAKLFVYFIFIAVVGLTEHITVHTTEATLVAIGLLVATEFISITENLVWLGLPVPYARQVLSVVSNKAKAFGFSALTDHADADMPYTKDMVQLLNDNVPRIKDTVLQECLQVYCASWYSFMMELNPAMFQGDADLAWARLKATIDRVLSEIQIGLARGQLDPELQRIFLLTWNRNLLQRFFQNSKTIATSAALPLDKVEQVRTAMMLMIYRLVNEAEGLDRASTNPIGSNPTLVIGPSIDP